jgi:Tol biopolymer transport system component
MTAVDRSHDRFNRRLYEALDDLASPQFPDYFDDVLAQAVGHRQRPAWTFPERWIPMSSIARPSVPAPPVLWRTLGIALLLMALLVATAVVSIGLRQQTVPEPFGPAANGVVAYAADGDIFTRDLDTGEETPVITGPELDVFPFFSRDGQSMAWFRIESYESNEATLMVAAPDGSDARALLGPTEIDSAAWNPSSDSLAVISVTDGSRELAIIPATAGEGRRVIDLPVVPRGDVQWRPPNGQELVFIGLDAGAPAIYAVGRDGNGLRQLTGSNGDIGHGPFEITPDGTTMLYTQTGTTTRVAVLDLDTGELRAFGEQLPSPPGYNGSMQHHGAPTLLPDGERITFVRYWNQDGDVLQTQIQVASLATDGADAVAVTPVREVPSQHNPYWQTVAPDGTQVLLVENDTQDAWLVPPAGGELQPVDFGEIGDPPSWQRVAP